MRDKSITTPGQVVAELRSMSAQFICPPDTYFANMAIVVESLTARLAAAEAFVAKHKCGKCGGVRVREDELCKCDEAAKEGRDATA